jgi:glycosyltransferase involved in cell wall biosynthesis
MSAAAGRVPLVGVVIPTFQRAANLPLLFKELADQTMASDDFEVIVVDDCSSDDTVAVVEQWATQVPYRLRVIGTFENSGPATARNLGWAATAAEVVAFLDDDCSPAPTWLAAGLGAFTTEPAAGVVQGATLLPEGVSTDGLIDWWVWREVTGPTAYFEGNNLFFRRVVLEQTGGFDEEISHYGEDCAAGWRVLEAGFERAFCAEAVVTHPLERRGFAWYVRNGYREHRIVACAAKHPGFRQAAFWRGWAYRKEDPALVAAVVGLLLSRWSRLALVAALPYLWWRRPSVRHLNFFRLCLQIPVVDAARVAGHLEGSLRHRVFVL